jgi:hypothetical protein
MAGDPEYLFIMHVDQCSSFPLEQMLDQMRANPKALLSIMGVDTEQYVSQTASLIGEDGTKIGYGFCQKDSNSDLLTHAFKNVSKDVRKNLHINCGIYLLSS